MGPATWRFHLRRGVTFHDGRPFGADDVVWSWTGREFLPRSVSGTLDRVVKVDDLTVDFVSTSPNLRLPEQLVHPEGPIVPKDAHNDATPPVGTGPFKVVDYQPRRQVVVERFDGYWGAKARADRLTFRFMPDPEIRLEALRKGEVDVATGLPREAAALGRGRRTLPRRPGQARRHPDPVVQRRRALRLRPGRAAGRVAGRRPEPLRGRGARRQRRAGPVDVASGGARRGRVDGGAVRPFDPARARQVLDEAGWKAGADGVRLNGQRRLTMVLIGGPAVPEPGLRLVAAQLKDVGFEVNVKKAFDIRTSEQNRDRGYDLELGMPNQNDANPAFLLASRTGDRRRVRGACALRPPRPPAARRCSGRRRRWTATIVNQDFSVVPLAGVFHVYGMRAGVDLAEPHPSAINQTWATLTLS